MEDLLCLREQGGKTVLSAKQLYDFLEIKTVFPNWCKRMFEYGFIENLDFMPILEESTGGRRSIDYALTLDCAKEISMIQRSEKGKQARAYFIECEKKLKEIIRPMSQLDMIIQSALALKAHEQRTILLEDKVKVLEAKTSTRPDYCTVIGYAVMHGLTVGLQMAARIGAKAKALCKLKGFTVESIPDPRFGRVGMYPSCVLEEVFNSVLV